MNVRLLSLSCSSCLLVAFLLVGGCIPRGGPDDGTEDAATEDSSGGMEDTGTNPVDARDSGMGGGEDTAEDTGRETGGDDVCTDPQTWYADRDNDGVGTSSTTREACTAPEGFVDESGDCNDMDPDVNPGATEVCDQVDNDCDGELAPGSADCEFHRLPGSGGIDVLYDVAVDADGNVYVVGDTDEHIGRGSNAGSFDGFLAKYDPKLNRQWVKPIASAGDDWSSSVAVDSQGNVYVGGDTDANLAGESNAGDYDAYIAKFDTAGNRDWLEMFGTSSGDSVQTLAVDDAGMLYAAGDVGGAFANRPFEGGAEDAFVAKYDPSSGLNREWLRLFGSSETDTAYGLAVDGAGDVYISGDTDGGVEGYSNAGFFDGFVAKYDASGTFDWADQFGTSGDDWCSEVVVGPQGNVYATGEVEGQVGTDTHQGLHDAFLRKYGANGTVNWTELFGSGVFDSATAAATNPAGEIETVGNTEGSFATGTNTGRFDVFGATYTSSRNRTAFRMTGTTSDEFLSGVAVDSEGRVYAVGETADALGNQPYNGGESDGALIRLK